MYLPERLKSLPVKSLYYGVLLAMVTTLSLSFLVFQSISNRIQKKSIDPAFDRIDEFELESARGALNSGGPALGRPSPRSAIGVVVTSEHASVRP